MLFLFQFACSLLAIEQVIEQPNQRANIPSPIFMSSKSRRNALLEYGLALAVFVVVSLLNLWLQALVGYQAVALVYLLAVVLLAVFVGRGPILFGTALTALGWSFMFAPPHYSFHIGSFYDKMMFGMYFVVALTVAQLTAKLREERLAEQKREERSRALYLFTRELADATDQFDILKRVIEQVGRVFNAEIALMLPVDQNATKLALFEKSTWPLGESEQAMAVRACEQNALLDDTTAELPHATQVYVPLIAGGRPAGTLAMRLKAGAGLNSEQMDLLENFARQTALVLDRQRLRDSEVSSRLVAESERFGRTLLNSVSHELRTPLAAIATAAATLQDSGGLSPIQLKLSGEIDSATGRLNRVVQSLLSAARIQAGQVKPNLDWCDISDVLRATVRELGPVLAQHRLERRLEPGLPLIRADFTLLQQAVGNLLVNASAYTPQGTQIELGARRAGSELLVTVADHGPGLPPDEIDRIFDVFHRPRGSRPGGTGLGLAIVKGFIEAQGGRVEARNRPEGGATFRLHLPIHKEPEISEEPA